MLKPEKPHDNITQRMRFACWITKATETLRICNTYCSSTATMFSRKHFFVTPAISEFITVPILQVPKLLRILDSPLKYLPFLQTS
jgi:hypothetical protein